MNNNKTARFDTKMSIEHKLLLEKACKLKGFKNLSEYVVSTMVADAKDAISDIQPILYSIEDEKRIMKILSEPTELSYSFIKASKSRQKKLNNEVSSRDSEEKT